MPASSPRILHASSALLPGGWARDVTVSLGADGAIVSVESGIAATQGMERVAGPLLPAMPNLHSHAFQRAMAGLAEVSGAGDDSFWTWREEMYRTVGLLSPEQVEVIATKLFIEMLKGGFGAVAEFHYLHNAVGGAAYADRAEMSRAVIRAARRAGIGLTLLPVFYAHANFGGMAPNPGQARFIHDVDGFLNLMESLVGGEGYHLGMAFHSLRAATPDEMQALLAALPAITPIHIHVAEQTREVEDCLAWSGKRPVEWLLDSMPVDARWCLIHATHVTADEVAAMAASRAVAGLCPATEANLGDGIFPGTHYLHRGGRFGIGTDSHVATGVAEELRTLEYGQRLRDRKRNRMVSGADQSVGRMLFDTSLAGGAQALGQNVGRIEPGAKASFVVLDGQNPYIAAAKDSQILDRWLFAVGDKAVRDVMVEGHWVIRDGDHAEDAAVDTAFRAVLESLAK